MFLGICPFHICPFIWGQGIQLFIVLSCKPFYFCKIGSNVSSFISDFSYLTLFSFFLVSLVKVLSNLLILLKNETLGFIDSLDCFPILYFISSLIFNISFFLTAFCFRLILFCFWPRAQSGVGSGGLVTLILSSSCASGVEEGQLQTCLPGDRSSRRAPGSSQAQGISPS